MTVPQLHFFNALYLAMLVVVAVLTRATARRVVGALAGGAVAGLVATGAILVGERAGWWHFVLDRRPYFLALFAIDFVLSGFVFLLTWRIARRFGARGLAITAALAAALGPVRDYAYMRQFPEWGAYAPGIAPALAIAATYVLLGALGHATMRLISGPARADRLARRPWERA